MILYLEAKVKEFSFLDIPHMLPQSPTTVVVSPLCPKAKLKEIETLSASTVFPSSHFDLSYQQKNAIFFFFQKKQTFLNDHGP